jgi:uncharacterized protein YgiM (DUF1202 family)
MDIFFRIIYSFFISACILNASLVYSSAALEPFIGEITADDINIRSDSTAGAESLCKINKGLRVEVVSEAYDWYKIRLPIQVPCFVKKEFVNTLGQGKAVVSTENVNIRYLPADSSLIVGRADKNEPVTIIGETGVWYKINPVWNSFGWVHKKFMQKASVQEMPQSASLIPAAPQIPENTPTPPETPEKPLEQRTELQVGLVIPKITKLAAAPKSQPSETTGTEGTITLTGLVKTYGNVINRPATHKLITRDKKVYLLRYEQSALNELVFHTVRITGWPVSLPNTKFPVIKVEKVEILD